MGKSRTLIEELRYIQDRMAEPLPLATIEGDVRHRLHVVATLLEKGWPPYQTIQPLIAQFGAVNRVPDCPVAPLPVPKWEQEQNEAEAPIPHDQQSLDEALKALGPFNLRDGDGAEEMTGESGPVALVVLKVSEVTDRGLEKIFSGDCEDHRIYGFLTVQLCGVQAEFEHDEAMVCVMLADYPDRENDLSGEPLVIFDTVTVPVGGRVTAMFPVVDRLVITDGEGRLGWPLHMQVA